MLVSDNIPEIELHYSKKVKSTDLVRIETSNTVNKILRELWSHRIEICEEFILLVLNRNNKVLGYVKISQGGIAGTVVDYRLILGIALKAAASGIIMAHNHPSGNTKPSPQDIALTRNIKQCCKLFDITLLDHLIISGDNEEYYSFADEGDL